MVDILTTEDMNLQNYPSSQLEVDGLGLMEVFSSEWTGPSDGSPPSDHDLFNRSNDQFIRHSPLRTPELAPNHHEYTIDSQYHEERALWHERAAKFHRQQATYLLDQSSELFDLTPPSEQPLLNSSCDTMSSDREYQSKNRHSRSSSISRHGAVKRMPSQPALPAHISKALLSQPGLQQFARISDPSELPTRTLTRLDFEPRSVYSALQTPPNAWGPNSCFTYNEYGELTPGVMFTVEEIELFLFKNPRDLTLFIQRNPSDSRSRYGEPAASRCRFQICPAAHYLIGQGHNRVCFDELSSRGENLDPFHNAGYVHLYCLERFLDFPLICSKLNVRVEDRVFPLEPGKNRMLLSSRLETKEVTKFIRRCKNNKLSREYPRSGSLDWHYQGTLCSQICLRKVEAEPPKVKLARKQRGDRKSTIGKHLGDLVMETKYRQQSRRSKKRREDGEGPDESDSGEFSGVRKSQMPPTAESQNSLYAGHPMPNTPVYAGPSTPYTYPAALAQATEQPLIEALPPHTANHGHEDDHDDHYNDDEMRDLSEELLF